MCAYVVDPLQGQAYSPVSLIRLLWLFPTPFRKRIVVQGKHIVRAGPCDETNDIDVEPHWQHEAKDERSKESGHQTSAETGQSPYDLGVGSQFRTYSIFVCCRIISSGIAAEKYCDDRLTVRQEKS